MIKKQKFSEQFAPPENIQHKPQDTIVQGGHGMVEKKDTTKLEEHMERLAVHLERAQFAEYVQLLNRPRRLVALNFISGIARGVGTGLGFTVIFALLLMILQELAYLKLPVIGKFLADLVKIVESQLHTPVVP
jgi:hypothetical protein